MEPISIIIWLALALVSFSFVAAITRFLQKGRIESTLTRKEVETIKAELRNAQTSEAGRPSEMYSIISALKKEVESIKGDFSHLSNEEKNKIVEGLKSSLKTTAAEEILSEIQSNVTNAHDGKLKLSIMERHFENTIGRLKEELFSLTKRSI